ncbi:MAG: sulfatase [Bacteroidetes bacterium]|nr:sulfatase [Bacteroidota bacterium]
MLPITKITCLMLLAAIAASAQPRRPNILFIAVDDLKPEIGAYGSRIAKTPNLDRLAASGTAFLANYCQQAVCGPTRASLLTGMRPDYTKVWDLKTRMRDMHPDILSLPQYFKSQGYTSQGIGKVYDPRCVDDETDGPSWSVPYHKTKDAYFAAEYGKPAVGRYQHPDNRTAAERYAREAQEKGLSKAATNDYVQEKVKPAVESADVPDNAYADGANVLQAIDILGGLAKVSSPFFFAVGLSKPHLPFVSPKRYWDLYNRQDMPVADYTTMPKNAPPIAMHNSGEIRSYTDISPLIDPATEKGYGLTLSVEKQRELLHGYYAAVSYLDANVGKLLRALDSLGLQENTIVVLWGDHGWHLGDHNLWCKHSNFEQATRTPLIISAPGLKATRTNSPSEFVDIFPTLCELTGLPIPAHLHGKSLVPVMKNPRHRVKEYSVSQYPRSGNTFETQRLGYADSKVMGYSLRTDRYRYTVWMGDGWKSWMPYDASKHISTELYDYHQDPGEKANHAGRPAMAAAQKELQGMMEGYFRSQVHQ